MPAGEQIALPPVTETANGTPRRVGVEIEFSGLNIDEAAELLRSTLFPDGGGALTHPGRYEIAVTGDAAGDWEIELDFAFLKSMGRRERDDSSFGDAVEGLAEDLLRMVAERVVPVEVIGPPLPMARLGELNRIVRRLREAGARGTTDDPAFAFGMQLNPEIPDPSPETVLRYLQAFLCIEDWLRERAQVDLTRRLTFFADPFPKPYARLAAAPDYAPDLGRLIDDYLDFNPTRNRALDMLPLFAHLDEARVRARIDDERVKPRPTLHYRLPNSEIDRPGWDLSVPWNDWLVVERLAAAPEALRTLCRDHQVQLDDPLGRITGRWKELCDQWLRQNGFLGSS